MADKRILAAVVALIGLAAAAVLVSRLFAPSVPPPQSADPEPVRPEPAPKPGRLKVPRLPGSIRFVEVGRQGGLDFRYYGSPTPRHFLTEQNGGGVALFDYDGDGRLDVFFTNGSDFASPAARPDESQQLFRAAGPLDFTNVTVAAALEHFGFGMGVAAGDFDNDGFTDLFVCAYGENRLWRNNGDGTFSPRVFPPEVARQWSSSAAFADLDGDGDLDLYVVNYVDYAASDGHCLSPHEPPIPISCGPLNRFAQPDLIYRNRGDGRFESAAQAAGVAQFLGKGLGVSIADFNGDGRLDVYVANDTTENLLFRNRGGLRFDEVALAAGAAVGPDGAPHAGMGIACGDYNRDGRFDLLVTNFANEPHDLYANLGPAGFGQRAAPAGLAEPSRPVLGFGAIFADFDLDGFLDLFVANGHVWDLSSVGEAYAMRPDLFRNERGRRFQEESNAAGPYFAQPRLGRAAAHGDLDNDGDADLIVSHLLEPPALLRNDSERASPSIRLRIVGARHARQPLGCRVDVDIAGETHTLRIPAGDSFQASNDPRLIVPLGEAAKLDRVTVHWPDATADVWENVPLEPNSEVTLIEGRAPPR